MSIQTSFEDFIEVIHCDTAREFMSFLNLSNEKWLPDNETISTWVFRGQRDANWPLLPRSLRDENGWLTNIKKQHREEARNQLNQLDRQYRPDEFQPDIDMLCNLVLQLYAEWSVVEEFITLADQVGHQIPSEDILRFDLGKSSIGSVIEALHIGKSSRNIERLYVGIVPEGIRFSLAQHHGIPTRLLDWTYDPYRAAYFAAEDASKKKDNGRIGVWAINRTGLDTADLRVVTPQKGKIEYLRAQEGLFLYDYGANLYFLKSGKWRGIEEVVKQISLSDGIPLLCKVTLPNQETIKLLRLLVAQRITRAHLMRTLDNVAETLKIMDLMNNPT